MLDTLNKPLQQYKPPKQSNVARCDKFTFPKHQHPDTCFPPGRFLALASHICSRRSIVRLVAAPLAPFTKHVTASFLETTNDVHRILKNCIDSNNYLTTKVVEGSQIPYLYLLILTTCAAFALQTRQIMPPHAGIHLVPLAQAKSTVLGGKMNVSLPVKAFLSFRSSQRRPW
jgi:hypothetical protein